VLDARCLSAFLLPLSFEAYDYTRLGMRLRKNDRAYIFKTRKSPAERPHLSDGAALSVIHHTKEHSCAGGVNQANDRRRRPTPRAAPLPLHDHKLKR